MKPYLLGIDIGTSACKVAVFEKSGTVVAAANGDYPVYYPKEGWAEQNPEEWWSAVCQAVKKAIQKAGIAPEEIAGIGIDGQSWSAIAMDKDGNVLTNTPIWMDTRAQSICDRLNEEIGAEQIFEVSGNSLQPSYTTAKILWYKENLPEVYQRIHKILQSNSYIAYKLTGVMSQDVSQGYGLHCFDMRKAAWDEDMCRKFGIPMEFLPEICACDHVVGTVTEKAAEESGLAVGTPVVAGGLDAACGTLGAGVIHPGETQEQGGQAGGMSICMDAYKADPRLILGYHVVPGQWLLQGGTTGGGGVMRWFEREFADYERSVAGEKGSSLNQLNEIAERVAPGSDGVVFLPYMSGERSPTAYVLTVVKHKCLNYLQQQQIHKDIEESIQSHAEWELSTRIATLEACNPSELFNAEAMEIVNRTLAKLPSRTREIFIMSRMQNMSHKEIAAKMDISTKGVEFHIGKALKELRISLKDYLPVFLYLFFY